MSYATHRALKAIEDELRIIQGRLMIYDDVLARTVAESPALKKIMKIYLDTLDKKLGAGNGPFAEGRRIQISLLSKICGR